MREIDADDIVYGKFPTVENLYQEGWNDAIDAVSRYAPTIRPLKAHWIDDAGNDKCSACGTSYPDLYPDYDRTPYCPHCGVKMEVENG